jgi:hypothetical protein
MIDLTRDVAEVKSTLEEAGFIINVKKFDTVPNQRLEFLGLILNTVHLILALTEVKKKAFMCWACKKLVGSCPGSCDKKNLSVKLNKKIKKLLSHNFKEICKPRQLPFNYHSLLNLLLLVIRVNYFISVMKIEPLIFGIVASLTKHYTHITYLMGKIRNISFY